MSYGNCRAGLATDCSWTRGRIHSAQRFFSPKAVKAFALLVACGHPCCGLAEPRSPLCLVYDGHRPEDPVYLNEFLKAKESPAISCVQQTAMRLSSGPETKNRTANILADDAVLACDNEAVKEAGAPSDKDGKPKVLADIRGMMKRSALVVIITMRAGRCF